MKHRGLPPHIRQAINERIAVLSAIESHRAHVDLSASDGAEVVDHLVATVIARTGGYWGLGAATIDAEASTRDMASRVRVAAGVVANQPFGDAVDEMLSACDLAATRAGEGSDLLLDVCIAVLAATEAAYAAAGASLPQEILEGTRFQFTHVSAPAPPGAQRDLAATAGTAFEADGSATVTITIGSGFDWRAFLAFPYLIFHECVSHVAQGPLKAGRTTATIRSAWAEGWMDRLALSVLRRTMEGTYGADLLRHFASSDGHARVGSSAHEMRVYGVTNDPFRASRQVGADAALGLRRLIVSEAPDADAAALVWALSAAINASAATQEQRDAFVRGVSAGLRQEPLRLLAEILKFGSAKRVAVLLAAVRA